MSVELDFEAMTDADFRKAVMEQFAVVRALFAAPKIEKPVEKLTLNRVEAMELAGYEPHELKAWYQFCCRHKLKPYRREHYRRCDVVEAVARAAFLKRKPVQNPTRSR